MRRTYVNIGAFFVLALVLIAWSVANYVPLGFLEHHRVVTAEFAESPGLRAGYEVTYLGVSVGRIDGVRLADGFSEVRLAIDHDADLPADIVAAARRRSAIGEPYVDLEPAPGTDGAAGPRLEDGHRITADRTSSPIQYGELFRSLDVLVNKLDAQALATTVHELSVAVDGRGDDIRRTIAGAHDLAVTASTNGDQIESLVRDLGTVAAVLAEHRQAIGSSIDDLAILATAFDEARPALGDALAEAPTFLDLLNGMLERSDDAVICTIDGLSVLQLVLDEDGQAAAAELLERSEAFAATVRQVQDPDDGILNLLVTTNSGEPPVVQYAEPAVLPAVAVPPPCPAHDVAFTTTAAAAADGRGAGGQRPAPDTVGPDLGVRADGAAGPSASGTSDVASEEPSLVRIGRIAVPIVAVLLAIAVAWVVMGERRKRARTGS